MRRYFIHFLIAVLLLTGTIMGFNWWVDPYAIWSSSAALGESYAMKPKLVKHERLHKAIRVKQALPESVILGTSRAEVGLDPRHPLLPKPSYNLGFSGTSIYETFRYFQHALAAHPMKQAILAVDFLQFNAARKTNEGFSEYLLLVDTEGHRQFKGIDELAATLLSQSALQDSLETLWSRGSLFDTLLPDGRLATVQRQGNIHRSGGHRNAAIRSEKSYIEKVYANFSFRKDDYNSLDCYKSLIELAYRNNTDMRIVISPSHARQWEVIAQMGLWASWESWKRHLVEINESTAKSLHKTPFPIWDFSGYSRFSTESFPLQNDRHTEMKWYWESSHYRVNVGNLVLDKVLGSPIQKLSRDENFGTLLSFENIDAHLKTLREQRASYIKSHPDDVYEISKLVLDANRHQQLASGH